ncbi:MAG: MBL fold metallo-hydrolase [Rubrivivax sp.]
MKRRLALLLLACCGPFSAAEPQAVADGVWMLPGSFEPGRQPDGNSLLLQGADGLLIVDTGRHIEHLQALDAWRRERGQPLRAVINTHWHLDHVGGNAALRRQVPGLRTLGSAALRDAVQQRMLRSQQDLQQRLADPQTDAGLRRVIAIDLALYAEREAFVPDERIEEGPPQDRRIAGRALRLGVDQGPTAGDVWVLDLESGVLALGDFVTLPVPFFDTACPSAWQAALARLEGLPFRHVVPGHGPLMSREDLSRYRQAFDRLLACAGGSGTVDGCAAGWIADLGPLLPEAGRRSVRPMLGYYFDSLLRAEPALRSRYCAAAAPR